MIKRVAKEIKEEILSRARKGKRVVTLAQQYGVGDKTIYNWLKSRYWRNSGIYS